MTSETGQNGQGSVVGERPCPGHQVEAACDLPPGTHNKTLVPAGTAGTIVRTPAYFSTTYSITFTVHGKDLTLHRIHRHEFRILDPVEGAGTPGYPPIDRYPQPHRVRPPDPKSDGSDHDTA
jgi:hypothetical protein